MVALAIWPSVRNLASALSVLEGSSGSRTGKESQWLRFMLSIHVATDWCDT